MIFDALLLFSDAQAITADGASSNVIDFAGTAIDPGNGKSVIVFGQIVEAFNTLTSLKVSLQASNVEDFSTGVETLQENTLLLADLTVGNRFRLGTIPRGVSKRYWRLYFDVVGTAPTTGKLTAGLVPDEQSHFVN